MDINDLTLGIIDDNTLKAFMYWEYMYNRRDDYYEAYLEEESSEKLSAYNEVSNDYEEVEIKTLLSGRLT